MSTHSRTKAVLAVLLACTFAHIGCSSQWIDVALADLPVLTQMSLNIGTFITTLESGEQVSADEAIAIQKVSSEASKDLNLLQSLYNDYKAHKKPETIQQIQSVISDINQNLPALLQAAHISDPTLSARISAGVNLIVVTVNSFAVLIPNAGGTVTASAKASVIPHTIDLKKQWNAQVCALVTSACLVN